MSSRLRTAICQGPADPTHTPRPASTPAAPFAPCPACWPRIPPGLPLPPPVPAHLQLAALPALRLLQPAGCVRRLALQLPDELLGGGSLLGQLVVLGEQLTLQRLRAGWRRGGVREGVGEQEGVGCNRRLCARHCRPAAPLQGCAPRAWRPCQSCATQPPWPRQQQPVRHRQQILEGANAFRLVHALVGGRAPSRAPPAPPRPPRSG